jgi:hypothetical protein
MTESEFNYWLSAAHNASKLRVEASNPRVSVAFSTSVHFLVYISTDVSKLDLGLCLYRMIGKSRNQFLTYVLGVKK